MFIRPIQALVLTPLFGARLPTEHERRLIEPLWHRLAQANHLGRRRLHRQGAAPHGLNACLRRPPGGGHHLALNELSEQELAGVLAHELSHHLGLHTVALHDLPLARCRSCCSPVPASRSRTSRAPRQLRGQLAAAVGWASCLAALLTVAVAVHRRAAAGRQRRQHGRPPQRVPGRSPRRRMGYGRHLPHCAGWSSSAAVNPDRLAGAASSHPPAHQGGASTRRAKAPRNAAATTTGQQPASGARATPDDPGDACWPPPAWPSRPISSTTTQRCAISAA